MSTQMRGIVDPLLGNVSLMQKAEGCVADDVFPALKSAQYTGKLAGYGKAHLRIENTVVGGKGKYRQVETVVRSTQGFEIEGHGLTGMVTKRDYKNVIDPFDAEADETNGLTSVLLLEKEKGMADALTSTGIITQNVTLSGTSQLSDYANSDPVSVFETAKNAIRAGCGGVANAVILEKFVASKLRYHPMLLDMLGYKFARPGGLTNEELAKVFEVDQVFIPFAMYNTAKEGQSDSMARIWGNHIIFAVLQKKAEKYQTCLGYNIRLDGTEPRKVYKQPIFNPPGSTEILVEDEYDLVIADASAAYLIKDAVAS